MLVENVEDVYCILILCFYKRNKNVLNTAQRCHHFRVRVGIVNRMFYSYGLHILMKTLHLQLSLEQLGPGLRERC